MNKKAEKAKNILNKKVPTTDIPAISKFIIDLPLYYNFYK